MDLRDNAPVASVAKTMSRSCLAAAPSTENHPIRRLDLAGQLSGSNSLGTPPELRRRRDKNEPQACQRSSERSSRSARIDSGPESIMPNGRRRARLSDITFDTGNSELTVFIVERRIRRETPCGWRSVWVTQMPNHMFLLGPADAPADQRTRPGSVPRSDHCCAAGTDRKAAIAA